MEMWEFALALSPVVLLRSTEELQTSGSGACQLAQVGEECFSSVYIGTRDQYNIQALTLH